MNTGKGVQFRVRLQGPQSLAHGVCHTLYGNDQHFEIPFLNITAATCQQWQLLRLPWVVVIHKFDCNLDKKSNLNISVNKYENNSVIPNYYNLFCGHKNCLCDEVLKMM
jgi:hypothetical protein